MRRLKICSVVLLPALKPTEYTNPQLRRMFMSTRRKSFGPTCDSKNERRRRREGGWEGLERLGEYEERKRAAEQDNDTGRERER